MIADANEQRTGAKRLAAQAAGPDGTGGIIGHRLVGRLQALKARRGQDQLGVAQRTGTGDRLNRPIGPNFRDLPVAAGEGAGEPLIVDIGDSDDPFLDADAGRQSVGQAAQLIVEARKRGPFELGAEDDAGDGQHHQRPDGREQDQAASQ